MELKNCLIIEIKATVGQLILRKIAADLINYSRFIKKKS